MKKYFWASGLILMFIGLGLFWWSQTSLKQYLVTLHTNQGDITIITYPKSAPKASKNFVTLSQRGLYDKTIFHRVITDFMIQGGDFEKGDGSGGQSMWGKPFVDEIDPKLSHVRGMVSMANHGPDTNSSQFFIVTKDTPRLDGRHSLFGQVLEGMEVVDEISAIPTDLLDKPLESVIIEGTTVFLP